MPDDQFTKLYNFVTERFDRLETKVDDKASKAQVEQLQRAVDHLADSVDTAATEQAAISQLQDRHEDRLIKLEQQNRAA